MASHKEIFDAILTPMTERFKAPPGMENHSRVLRDYAEDLAGYSAEQLQAGWRELRRTHQRTTWPLMAEISKAIKEGSPVSDGSVSYMPSSEIRAGKIVFPEDADYTVVCEAFCAVLRDRGNRNAYPSKLKTKPAIEVSNAVLAKLDAA